MASYAYHMVFFVYMHEDILKVEFLFCASLNSQTKEIDILKMLDCGRFFAVCALMEHQLLCHTALDLTHSEQVPDIKWLRCMIHRQALTSKTLPDLLASVLQDIKRAVSFKKEQCFKHAPFLAGMHCMDSMGETLFFYTEAR